MENRIDVADRLAAISEELMGAAQILFIMYENDLSAVHLMMLSKTVERYSKEISEIEKEL